MYNTTTYILYVLGTTNTTKVAKKPGPKGKKSPNLKDQILHTELNQELERKRRNTAELEGLTSELASLKDVFTAITEVSLPKM